MLFRSIRAASPAGVTPGFIKPDAPTFAGKLDRSGKASETSADDMHRTQRRSHARPCRNTSQSLSSFDMFTRVAGSRHPERNSAESVAW